MSLPSYIGSDWYRELNFITAILVCCIFDFPPQTNYTHSMHLILSNTTFFIADNFSIPSLEILTSPRIYILVWYLFVTRNTQNLFRENKNIENNTFYSHFTYLELWKEISFFTFILCNFLLRTLKVSWFYNVFLKWQFLPKYQRNYF